MRKVIVFAVRYEKNFVFGIDETRKADLIEIILFFREKEVNITNSLSWMYFQSMHELF